jgi:ribosomal protein S18 acetylase RimI-like enzyme
MSLQALTHRVLSSLTEEERDAVNLELQYADEYNTVEEDIEEGVVLGESIYLAMIEVDEEYRGRGIARKVITELSLMSPVRLYCSVIPESYSTMSTILNNCGWKWGNGDSFNFYL